MNETSDPIRPNQKSSTGVRTDTLNYFFPKIWCLEHSLDSLDVNSFETCWDK